MSENYNVKINAAALKAASISSKSSTREICKYVQINITANGYEITGTDGDCQIFHAVQKNINIDNIDEFSLLLDATTLYKHIKVSHKYLKLTTENNEPITSENIETLAKVKIWTYNNKHLTADTFICPIGKGAYPNCSPYFEAYKKATPGTAAISAAYLKDVANMAQCFGKKTAISIMFSGQEEKDKLLPIFFKYYVGEYDFEAFSLTMPVRI